MPGEKHHEDTGWKNKLEDPACLPVALDKEAAWDLLHARLYKKPARKRKRWYWLAAACLLLAVGMTWLLHSQKNTGIAKQPAHRPVQAPLRTAPLLSHSAATTTLQAESLAPVVKTGALPHNTKAASPVVTKNNTLPAELPIPPIETPVVLAAHPAPDTATLATVPVAPVKKLRVIAINELDPPAEEPAKPGKSAGKLYYQMKKLNKNTYADASTRVEHTAPDILTIKLAPQN